jgi:hypothetical protein
MSGNSPGSLLAIAFARAGFVRASSCVFNCRSREPNNGRLLEDVVAGWPIKGADGFLNWILDGSASFVRAHHADADKIERLSWHIGQLFDSN